MRTSESINEIATALSRMQGEMDIAAKSSKGYNYKYSDLSSVWLAVSVPMHANGLSITQDALSVPEGVTVITRIMHCSGQWIEHGPLLVPMGKKDAHSTGSAITYGRRYALCAALSIITIEDDDGALAQKAAPKEKNDDEIVTEFLEKWGEKYGREGVVNFIKERSAMFSMEERAMVKIYRQNDEGFVKEIEAWIAKKMENQDSEEATLQ